MNIFIKYILVLFGAGGITYILTPLMRKIAWKVGLLAEPGGRRVHDKTTPLTGGIAVFMGMHLACTLVFCGSQWGVLDGHMNLHWWRVLLLLSSVVLLLGVLDDKLELSPSIKLFGQVAIAVSAYFSGIHIGEFAGISLNPLFDIMMTVLWFLGFMNAFNLIDGMDGLASGLGAIAATGMAVIFVYRGYPSNTLVMLALTGSCLAFLRFNFSPATIFLGDAGSMFIGFVLAFVALLTNSKSTTIAAIGIPMLAIGVPVLDTLLAIWRRSIRAGLHVDDGSGKITNGDRDHLHHRLARRGFTQRKVVVGLYMLNLAFVFVGVGLTVFKSHSLGILLIAFVAGTYVLVRHLAYVEFRDSGKLLATEMNRSVSRIVAVLIYIPLDVMIMMGLSLLAVTVTNSQGLFTWNRIKHLWLQYMPLYVGVPFLVLCIGRTYRTVWSRARVTDYVRLAAELSSGVLVGFGFFSFFYSTNIRQHFYAMIVYAVFLIPTLVVLRALWRIMRDILQWVRPKEDEKVNARRTVIVGSGKQCVLYLRSYVYDNFEASDAVYVIAIIDDDANLHHRYVHGIKVAGGLDCLRSMIRKEKIDQVVLTCELSCDDINDLFAVMSEEKVSLVRFGVTLEKVDASICA